MAKVYTLAFFFEYLFISLVEKSVKIKIISCWLQVYTQFCNSIGAYSKVQCPNKNYFMELLIIDDNKIARTTLRQMVSQVKELTVAGECATAMEAYNFLQGKTVDLLLLDIEMPGMNGLELTHSLGSNSPVIVFTTSKKEYATQAFDLNVADYLLKPVLQEKLETALKKYETLKKYFTLNYQKLKQWQSENNEYKKRFLVKRGADYISIKTEDIPYFYATHKLVCMVDNKNQKFILDQSLADIETRLDPSQFYRVNRKYLINITAIKLMKTYSKGKLKLEVTPPVSEDIIVAQENVAAFKEWVGR